MSHFDFQVQHIMPDGWQKGFVLKIFLFQVQAETKKSQKLYRLCPVCQFRLLYHIVEWSSPRNSSVLQRHRTVLSLLKIYSKVCGILQASLIPFRALGCTCLFRWPSDHGDKKDGTKHKTFTITHRYSTSINHGRCGKPGAGESCGKNAQLLLSW